MPQINNSNSSAYELHLKKVSSALQQPQDIGELNMYFKTADRVRVASALIHLTPSSKGLSLVAHKAKRRLSSNSTLCMPYHGHRPSENSANSSFEFCDKFDSL